MSTTWDYLDTSASPPPPPITAKAKSKISELALRLRKIQAEMEVLDAERNLIELELGRFFPAEEGTFLSDVEGTDLVVQCRVTERWVWDKDHLKSLFGGEMPSYVKQSLSVDRREYKRLTPDERKMIEPALTRKLDRPKITVRMGGPDV